MCIENLQYPHICQHLKNWLTKMVEADKGLRMSLIKVSDRTASSEFRGCEKLNPSLESDRRSLLLGGNVRIFALWKTSGISMMKCVGNTARK